ncbi:MAG: hypothetical protein JNN15_14245 [Blastocatellia bacterium]|nr:hypothetical protein [Blastocatellia bacterium]
MQRYPKYLSYLKRLDVETLCSLEQTLIVMPDSVRLERFGCEVAIPQNELLRLLRLEMQERIEARHIDLEALLNWLERISDKKERIELYFHLARCSRCTEKIWQEYLPQISESLKQSIDREFLTIVDEQRKRKQQEHKTVEKEVEERKRISSKDPTLKVKIPAILQSIRHFKDAEQKAISNGYRVDNFAKVKAALMTVKMLIEQHIDKIKVLMKKTVSKKLARKIAVSTAAILAIAAVLSTGFYIWEKKKTVEGVEVVGKPSQLYRSAFTVLGENPIQLAQLYEEASQKLKQAPEDVNLLLNRAAVAEKLHLYNRAIEDYEQALLKTSDALIQEDVRKRVEQLHATTNQSTSSEATKYEQLDKLINGYLQARRKKDRKQAESNLAEAKVVAASIFKENSDKVGIDLVDFYSKVSLEAGKELLEARLQTEEVSKVVATDLFQDSINKLEKAKAVFVKYNAVADIQSTSAILAKFLPKAGQLADARMEIDGSINEAKEKQYTFIYTRFLYLDAELNIYERKEQEALRKCLEVLSLCKDKQLEKFSLYPLIPLSYLYLESGKNELAFEKAVEGIGISIKYRHHAFASQFFQNAGLAATGMNSMLLAETLLQNSVDICAKENLIAYGVVAKVALANVLAYQQNISTAIKLIEETKYKDLGMVVDITARKQLQLRVLGYEGKVYGLAKEFIRAENAYKNAIETSKELGYKDFITIGQWRKGLAEALIKQGRIEEGIRELNLANQELKKVSEGLHPERENPILDFSFSGKKIDELMKSAQEDLIQP